MKVISVLVLALFGSVIYAQDSYSSNKEKRESILPDGLVVHEWGIIKVELDDSGQVIQPSSSTQTGKINDLPPFVEKAELLLGVKAPALPDSPILGSIMSSTGGLEIGKIATSLAEEPFIYFYSKKAIEKVRVAITMPMDCLSFYYPSGAIGATKLFCWNNLFISPDKPKDKELAKIDKSHWWTKARDTDSAYIATATGNVEKFLFYETAGLYKLPFRNLEVTKDGILKGELGNIAKGQALSNVWLVSVSRDKKVRVEALDKIKPNEKFESKPSSWKYMEAPAVEFAKLLKKSGLYEKEAEGLAEIRRKKWWETEGIRMLYLLTQEEYDTLFPLTITPKPDEIKRVMVVQIEFPNTKIQK